MEQTRSQDDKAIVVMHFLKSFWHKQAAEFIYLKRSARASVCPSLRQTIFDLGES